MARTESPRWKNCKRGGKEDLMNSFSLQKAMPPIEKAILLGTSRNINSCSCFRISIQRSCGIFFTNEIMPPTPPIKHQCQESVVATHKRIKSMQRFLIHSTSLLVFALHAVHNIVEPDLNR